MLNILARIVVIYKILRKKIFSDKKCQFSYCPIAWMFCLGTSNNIINKLHERSLRIILDDYSSDFKEFLENDDIYHHHRNIQTFLIEVFTIKTNLLLQHWSQFQIRESIFKSKGAFTILQWSEKETFGLVWKCSVTDILKKCKRNEFFMNEWIC